MKQESRLSSNHAKDRTLKILFYAGIVVTILLDVLVSHAHAHLPWEAVPGFYAVFGLVACVLLIGIAKTLGNFWLFKKEDYYE